jgi:hypothetical protein
VSLTIVLTAHFLHASDVEYHDIVVLVKARQGETVWYDADSPVRAMEQIDSL